MATTVKIELTDTFGGEANYSWVRREDVEVRKDTRLAIVRAAKAWAGWQGVRCQVSDYGDQIEIRPAGMCQVMFVDCWE